MPKVKTGDHIIITTPDRGCFEALAVSGNVDTILFCKVLTEGFTSGSIALPKYGLNTGECYCYLSNSDDTIEIVTPSQKLNLKENVEYYKTVINEQVYTCCINEDKVYGWSTNTNEKQALTEAYSNSKGSSLHTLLEKATGSGRFDNDWIRSYSPTFEDEENYKKALESGAFKIIEKDDNLFTLFITVDLKDTEKFITDVSNYEIKQLTESKYTLQKYFMENFGGKK